MLESKKLQNKIYSLLDKEKYNEDFLLLERENKEYINNKDF
tara:strand:- start:2995 stop:3117 length:123 start_codon:yes stop_codon:yes gene_type:complete